MAFPQHISFPAPNAFYRHSLIKPHKTFGTKGSRTSSSAWLRCPPPRAALWDRCTLGSLRFGITAPATPSPGPAAPAPLHPILLPPGLLSLCSTPLLLCKAYTSHVHISFFRFFMYYLKCFLWKGTAPTWPRCHPARSAAPLLPGRKSPSCCKCLSHVAQIPAKWNP